MWQPRFPSTPTAPVAGVALRHWLADEVLPALRADGFYEVQALTTEAFKGMQEARLRRKDRARLVYELGNAIRTLHGPELRSKLELLPTFFDEEAARILGYCLPLLERALPPFTPVRDLRDLAGGIQAHRL